MEFKFIVDINVGKLAKWLRLMGYDTLLFKDEDDGEMIKIASQQNRIILTRDSQFMKRRLITEGKIKAILVKGDNFKIQLQQIASALDLDFEFKPFSLCLECNESLIEKNKDKVRNIVPPYVFKTQSHYMECPSCHRIYWHGTHWQAMSKELDKFRLEKQEKAKVV